ncbi:MAG: hypothetical protein R3E50_12245 [Halioglobus sp.]
MVVPEGRISRATYRESPVLQSWPARLTHGGRDMIFKRNGIVAAISVMGLTVAFGGAHTEAAVRVYGTAHTFTINDLQANLDGQTFGQGGTYGASGIANTPAAICGIGLPTTVTCPADGPQPMVDKEGIRLFPVNSNFGFDVVDFLGAQEKSFLDGRYEEGFVGNIVKDNKVIGVKVSNAETDTYKVRPPMGTWCQGLGGTSIKCSTEHYTVMEHVLSCHEVIPYYFADPSSGQQAYLTFPNPEDGTFDCAEAALDDNLIIRGGENDGQRLASATPGDQILANDNTTVLRDIAVSQDYSVTLKDDGKPLYRWGSLIKRPNDIRFYARMTLPDSWKQPGADFPVLGAALMVKHWITNNPNDQLRPEDLENEAATGRKPSYRVEANGDWTSLVDCYEGDGDYLPSEEGSVDPVPIPAGTVFKNAGFALDAGDDPGTQREDNPYAFSADLTDGFTNGYYTTVNRNPFQWSYVRQDAVNVFNFVGSDAPLSFEALANQKLKLVSGPRWRLKANKFGQDVPGLEIPMIECSPPPYGNDNIRYQVGTEVTTVINLLDWNVAVNGPSPLSTTRGWVDVAANNFVTVAGETSEVAPGLNPVKYTTNGLPMTSDFDLAVYIKGDRKSTALYSAILLIWVDEPPVTP